MAGRGTSGHGMFGALLRNFRLVANMTQEELAERSGLSVEGIAALERGVRRSPRPSTVELLAVTMELGTAKKEALIAAARGVPVSSMRSSAAADTSSELAEAESRLASMPTDAVPQRSALPTGSRMPLAPNPLFVGRGDELLQIASALRTGDTTVALGQVVASTGLGGLGKTQLAVEFVHRYGRFFTGGVFWLSFASADEVPLQVAACAGPDAMDLAPGIESLPLEERVKRVQRAWQGAAPRLLVFDNCEEEALLDTWRPTSGACRVLVTSPRSHWSPTLGVSALPLDILPRPDSIGLLRRYRPDSVPDDPGLDAIAHELGDLPLALHLAGSYLRAYRTEVTLDDYLAELRRSEVVRHASLLGAGLGDSPSPTHHVQGVAQTFALCLGRLDREREVDQVAIAVLARMACLAPGEPVPRDLLARTLDEVNPLQRADGLRRLGAVGLVEEGEGWLRLHRLVVHFVRQEGLDPDALPAVARALIGYGEDAYQRRLTGSAARAVIPHLVQVAGSAAAGPGDERLAAELCIAVGRTQQYAGDLRASRPWFGRALDIRERVLGANHACTAEGLDHLGVLLNAQGELTAAQPLLERALAVRERTLGAEHPDTATSLKNLALLLRAQGKLDASRPLFERALAIRERMLGPDHPDTGQAYNNLGALLRDRGDLAGARPLLQRALTIRERMLGPEHPETAFTLNNLALLLDAQGELTAAQPLYERALAIRERMLGPDHPDTAISLKNLALLRRARGEPAAARPLLERALAIRERVLGPDHPDTVATRRALEELAAEGGGAEADG